VAANATDIVNNELQLITHGVNFTVHGQNIDANSALILSNLANINGHSSNINSHANIQTAILDIGNAHAQGSFGSDFDHSNLQVLGDLNVTNRIFLGGFLLHQSDGRLKKNIEPIDDALETVQSLRGVTFHRTQQSDDDPLHYGFIAQEVLEVVPDLVALGPDGEHYAIDYSAFVGLLTEAIKEQAVQIDELEAANKDLLRAARSTAQRLQRIEARLSISAAR